MHGIPPSAAPDGAGAPDRVAVADRIEATLAEVDAALGRLDHGTFGTCARCGAAIAADRLADDVLSTDCGCTDAA